MVHRSKLGKELRKLSEEPVGLVKRLRKFLKESEVTQEQAIELCDI